jgi:hypothetical protein
MPAGRELPAVIKNRNYPQPVKHPKPTALGFYLELRIGSTAKHPDRQFRLMRLLGLSYSYDQWRKHPRLERGFLVILAEHMVGRAKVQTTDQTA